MRLPRLSATNGVATSLNGRQLAAEAVVVLAACAIGVLVALLAWQINPGWLLLLVLLPAATRSRTATGVQMLCYYAFAARGEIVAIERFFDAPLALALAGWLLHASLLALPYALLARRWWGFATAMLIATLPPLGFLGWLSPLIAAASFFPGAGAWGLAAMAGVYLVIGAAFGAPQRMGAIIAFGALAVLSLVIRAAETTAAAPGDWHGQSTALGLLADGIEARYERSEELQALARRAIDEGAKVMIFPEGVAGDWGPGTDYWWRHTTAAARARGAVLVIGAHLRGADGRPLNAVVIRGAETGTVAALVPMPLSMWPTFGSSGAAAETMIDGQPVLFAVCFEEFLPWLPALARGQPRLLVGIANHWFAAGSSASEVQQAHAAAIARLYGMASLRAANTAR